jgi:hypothetical protein
VQNFTNEWKKENTMASTESRKKARAMVEAYLDEQLDTVRPPEGEEVDLGWAFDVGSHTIESNLSDLFYNGPEDDEVAEWVTQGWVTPDGELTREGTDELTDGLLRMERNFIQWMKKTYSGARDEGHGPGDELVGTFWLDTGDRKQLKQLGQFTDANERNDEYELIDHEFYEPEIYKGVSSLAARLADLTTIYFNVPEWLAEMIRAT